MVNIDIHRNNLVIILREIYSDTLLRNVLGFKGGTAAMLFYELPRFSIDLDFDLLDFSKKEVVFQRLKEKLQEELMFYLKLYLSNAFRRQERVV